MQNDNALAKNKKDMENSFANAPLKKKMGFFSSVMIIIGSVIGAGIFFKSQSVLAKSQGSILFSIFCWLLAVAAIIFMALALIEISAARNDNLSIIGWCRTFNSRFVYKSCRNFMVYLYIPLTFFFSTLYFIQSIHTGIIGLNPNSITLNKSWAWLVFMISCLAITWYFTVTCGLSSKLGNIQNQIITCINMLPVAIAIIFGVWGVIKNGGLAGGESGVANHIINNSTIDYIGFIPQKNPTANDTYNLAILSPGFGLFIAMGAIFFAYDGFYVGAGLQSEMKEPKKTPIVLLVGLLVITGIYLSVAIAMSLGSIDGGPKGLEWIFEKLKVKWLYGLFQVLIAIGVLSIINGFALWSPRLIENLMLENELPFSAKYINKLNNRRPIVGVIYSIIISTIVIIVSSIIGSLGYLNTLNLSSKYGSIEVLRLYSFGDLIGTWASVGAFLFILLPIINALKNRKTKFVYIRNESKTFIPGAIGSIVLLTPAIFMTVFEPIANLFMLFNIPRYDSFGQPINYNVDYVTDILVPRVMTVVALILNILVATLPIVIEDLYWKKKYGSVKNREIQKIKELAVLNHVSDKEIIYRRIKANSKIKLSDIEKEILHKNLTEQEIIQIITR